MLWLRHSTKHAKAYDLQAVVAAALHVPLVEISGGEIASLCYFKSTAHRRHQVIQLKVGGAAEVCPKEKRN